MTYEGPIRVLSIYGDNKTCKTSLALTGPYPLKHFDFDLGFLRAAPRFRQEVIDGLVSSQTYAVPLQLKPPRIMGVRELWAQFQADYLKCLEDESIASIVIDTHTQLWEVCRLGFLQEKQDNQFYADGNIKKLQTPDGKVVEQSLRERLLPIEYGEPNSRMRSIIYAARSKNKVLIITHYARDVYQTNLLGEERSTGEREADAWKYVPGLCDVMVKTELTTIEVGEQKTKVTVPQATIELSGVSLGAVGLTIVEPTFEKLSQAVTLTSGG